MRKIKIIKSSHLQNDIDKWIKEEDPIIISSSIASVILQNGNLKDIISIIYDEKGSNIPYREYQKSLEVQSGRKLYLKNINKS